MTDERVAGLAEDPSVGSGSLLEIGRVLRPRGLRGELRVKLHFADSDALSQVRQVWVRRPREPDVCFGVRACQRGHRCVFLRLLGVDDLTAAGALRGAALLVERADLPPLAAGEYYLVDLLGAAVVGPEGPIGEVTAVENHPSVDAIVISTPAGARLEQPLLDDFVAEVDVARRRIVLRSLDGVIDSG